MRVVDLISILKAELGEDDNVQIAVTFITESDVRKIADRYDLNATDKDVRNAVSNLDGRMLSFAPDTPDILECIEDVVAQREGE